MTHFVAYFFFLLDIVKFVSALILLVGGVMSLLFGCLLICTGDFVSLKTLNTYAKTFLVSAITGICAIVINLMVSYGKELVAMYAIP